MLAQTTDSGSNNNTMASAMYGLLNDNRPEKQSSNAELLDPASMHICCFCHKIALIVNAGLESLSLKTLPPSKAKESILGFFPVLGTLAEEEEKNDPAVTTDKNKTVGATINVEETVDSDYGNADNEGSDAGSEVSEKESNDGHIDVASNANCLKHAKTLRLKDLTQKLDVVIKQITRLSAQRANFERTAKNMNIKVAPLIAGYGIRWNIKYQSYRKAIDAREVIDRLLKDDQEANQAGNFSDVMFLPRDWKEIDNLNCELEVFVKLTAEMEGNHPTGAHVIPKYLTLKEQLQEKKKRAKETDTLCEVKDCINLLDRRFQLYKEQHSMTKKKPVHDSEVVEIERPVASESQSLIARLASQGETQPAPLKDEVQIFLKAKKRFSVDAIGRKETPLKWWKANSMTYPALSRMARAYLGASGSSCSV
ncbi:hypothetical protein PCASD_14712 [Puccinia coronata f. sp. avenae]|uniref:HAT C-terminal dimerisation domain-containing protein n=1 Tax=Puccinia coronata f. sp. avenae TaxID=200324 RepID=A0A2N5TEH7_9BASI|nr:hypothetical protein PCASD_14712 [Puccinia coronata f. sp. avenae]